MGTHCSGIGAPEVGMQELAEKLGFDYENVFACEKDKYARLAYNLLHTTGTMYEDMQTEEWNLPKQYVDYLAAGIPCQAFSIAGKRLGELDLRGVLFYDLYRYIKNQQPKVVVIENVKGLLTTDKGTIFQNWLLLLGRSVNKHEQMFRHPDSLEYNIHWTVLNSKDFGVPQNRERVFIVCIRKDLPNTFRFPKGMRLTKRLIDVLQERVDEKYYLSDKMIAGFMQHMENSEEKNRGFKFEPIKDANTEIASAIRANVFKMGPDDNYICESLAGRITGRNPENPKSRKKGIELQQTLEINDNPNVTNTITTVEKDNVVIELRQVASLYENNADAGRVYDSKGIACTIKSDGGGGGGGAKTGLYVVDEVRQLNPSKESGGQQPYQQNRVFDAECISPAIDTECGRPNYLVNQRIRRLTPRECYRLMGQPDSNFDKVEKELSDTQLYRQAGNSIVVQVIKAIQRNLLPILLR